MAVAELAMLIVRGRAFRFNTAAFARLACEVESARYGWRITPSPTPLAEILQFTLMAAYVSYYLGIIYDSDPNKIEVVDFLKERLMEHPFEEK